MTTNSNNKDILEMELGQVVTTLKASTDPVAVSYLTGEFNRSDAYVMPQDICKLSLCSMSKTAWENLGVQISSGTAVGVFYEERDRLSAAVLDGESVIMRTVITPLLSEVERIRAQTFIYSTPGWANIKNSQSLALNIILNCIAKYALNALVQRLFLPWGSVPLSNVKKILH